MCTYNAAYIAEQADYSSKFIALVNREYRAGRLELLTPKVAHDELFIAGIMTSDELYDWMQGMWECDLIDGALVL